MIIKCPVCGERHIVPDHYDNKEYICRNTANRRNQKVFQNMIPTDLLTRNNYPMNRSSTKVDEGRAVTVKIQGPSYRRNGEKVDGEIKKNY